MISRRNRKEQGKISAHKWGKKDRGQNKQQWLSSVKKNSDDVTPGETKFHCQCGNWGDA